MLMMMRKPRKQLSPSPPTSTQKKQRHPRPPMGRQTSELATQRQV